jgi:hypothetical protein
MTFEHWNDTLKYLMGIDFSSVVYGEYEPPDLTVIDEQLIKRFEPKPTDVIENAQFEEVL